MIGSHHNHSHYSNLRLKDSITKPSKLLDRALELGYKSLSITDHACLSGHVDIQIQYEKLKEKGEIPSDFKLILGDEIYLTTDLESKGEYYHQVLLAKDEVGHRLLREIETKAWKNSYSYKGLDRVPITFQEVANIIGDKKGHLISLSACLGSYLGKKVSQWKQLELENAQLESINFAKSEIHSYMNWCIDLFGSDFYLEVQPSDTFDQLQYNESLRVLSLAYNVPMVFSNDSHYAKESDKGFHHAFLNSQDGDRETESFYKFAYMMTYEEIKNLLNMTFEESEIEKMRLNTIEIGNKCEYYSLYKPQHVPTCDFDLSKLPVYKDTGYKNIDRLLAGCDEDQYWIRYCLKNLAKKNLWNSEYLQRLDIEVTNSYK